jgi:hypothetical protein
VRLRLGRSRVLYRGRSSDVGLRSSGRVRLRGGRDLNGREGGSRGRNFAAPVRGRAESKVPVVSVVLVDPRLGRSYTLW